MFLFCEAEAETASGDREIFPSGKIFVMTEKTAPACCFCKRVRDGSISRSDAESGSRKIHVREFIRDDVSEAELCILPKAKYSEPGSQEIYVSKFTCDDMVFACAVFFL